MSELPVMELVPVRRRAADPIRVTALPPMPEAMADGLCASHPQPDLWTSSDAADRRQAQAVCRQCPVRQPCADWATANIRVMDTTIYGGMNAAERVRARREAARAASAGA
jgi:hypothetical protein